jgi:hypothetical protein
MRFIRLIRNRRGLGAPVGNLIILMAAVVLSTTVVLFATNITSSQVQKETMYIPSSHIWYVNSTYSVAAVAITDTGPTDIVLSRIVIKGLTCQWNSTDNFVVYAKANGTLPGDLPYAGNLTNSANSTIIIGNQPFVFMVATEGLTLKTGSTMAFYITIPNRMMVYDLATSSRIVITTTQAVYCTDTLVQTV